MAELQKNNNKPWCWVPTLYLAEGMPYALLVSVPLVLYKNLGMANREIVFFTAWLYLPWVLKPLWSPVVDVLKTRRQWIWGMELTLGAGLGAVALSIPGAHFFTVTLVLFWLLALVSATHDIAADGFYILALPEHDQALFSGVRNTFYRVANIAVQGGLVVLAGAMRVRTGSYTSGWMRAFVLAAAALLALGFFHRGVLPRPTGDVPGDTAGTERGDFAEAFVSFFRKPKILILLGFLLFYRLGEAQLLNVARLFLLDSRAQGGLGLTDQEYGTVYGMFGVGTLLFGGLLGGWVVSRQGLKFWLWPMLLAIHLPDSVFIWLAYDLPQNPALIAAAVMVEQLGYGFGFTAFMLYMIHIARGRHATAHYAICTGFMALGLMVPGLWSGWLQELIGYRCFFIWVILATIPSFIMAAKIPLEAEFGRKRGVE